MTEDDPFRLYYDLATGHAEPQTDANATPTPLPWEENKENKPESIKTDAKVIRSSINAFIKGLSALIGRVFNKEKEKGTRPDLIVTLVLGGLAFTLANVYHLITKNMGHKMSATEYESTFMGMYKTAMKDIGEKDKPL